MLYDTPIITLSHLPELNVHVALSSGKQEVSSIYCVYAWAKPPHQAPIDQSNYS